MLTSQGGAGEGLALEQAPTPVDSSGKLCLPVALRWWLIWVMKAGGLKLCSQPKPQFLGLGPGTRGRASGHGGGHPPPGAWDKHEGSQAPQL